MMNETAVINGNKRPGLLRNSTGRTKCNHKTDKHDHGGEEQREPNERMEECKGDAMSLVGQEDSEFKFLVQGALPFSKSILWEQMRRFYETQGVEAWASGLVPFFITCNAFIAKRYAKVIHAYLCDLLARGALDPNEPVVILELGVGSGKFSFLVLKALLERFADAYGHESDAPFKIRYVMSDFCSTGFHFWKEHASLQRYFKSGVLDYCRLDACRDTVLELEVSGESIRRGSLKNPLVVLANYLFDSLPADAFRVTNGKLQRGRVAIWSSQAEADTRDPGILNRFKARWEWEESLPSDASKAMYNTNKHLQDATEAVLAWYENHFCSRDAGFLMPTASLECLENLRAFTQGGRLAVLSGDKGTSNTIALQQTHDPCDPHIAVHGSFSLMVNYHALGLWFDANGGFAMHCPLEDASLKVSMFVLDQHHQRNQKVETHHWNCFGDALPRRTHLFPTLSMAFKEAMSSFGPDHFYQLQQHNLFKSPAAETLEHGDGTMRAIAAMLQLSDWDADLVFKYREVLLENLAQCGPRLLDDLRRGMERAWSNYFFLEPEKDFAFELGRFHYGLEEYERALVFYTKSLELVGSHHVTEHNIGLCYSSLGNKHKALEFFQSSLRLNPNYAKAQQQHDLLCSQLNVSGRRPKALDLTACGERVLASDSPLNSPHVRVSFDPEFIHRTKAGNSSSPMVAAPPSPATCSTTRPAFNAQSF